MQTKYFIYYKDNLSKVSSENLLGFLNDTNPEIKKNDRFADEFWEKEGKLISKNSFHRLTAECSFLLFSHQWENNFNKYITSLSIPAIKLNDTQYLLELDKIYTLKSKLSDENISSIIINFVEEIKNAENIDDFILHLYGDINLLEKIKEPDLHAVHQKHFVKYHHMKLLNSLKENYANTDQYKKYFNEKEGISEAIQEEFDAKYLEYLIAQVKLFFTRRLLEHVVVFQSEDVQYRIIVNEINNSKNKYKKKLLQRITNVHENKEICEQEKLLQYFILFCHFDRYKKNKIGNLANDLLNKLFLAKDKKLCLYYLKEMTDDYSMKYSNTLSILMSYLKHQNKSLFLLFSQNSMESERDLYHVAKKANKILETQKNKWPNFQFSHQQRKDIESSKELLSSLRSFYKAEISCDELNLNLQNIIQQNYLQGKGARCNLKNTF